MDFKWGLIPETQVINLKANLSKFVEISSLEIISLTNCLEEIKNAT